MTPLGLGCSVIVSVSCECVCSRICRLPLLHLRRVLQRLAKSNDRTVQGTVFLTGKVGSGHTLLFCTYKKWQVFFKCCFFFFKSKDEMQTDRERRFGLLQIIVSLLMQMFLLHLRSVLCGLVESNDRTCTALDSLHQQLCSFPTLTRRKEGKKVLRCRRKSQHWLPMGKAVSFWAFAKSDTFDSFVSGFLLPGWSSGEVIAFSFGSNQSNGRCMW